MYICITHTHTHSQARTYTPPHTHTHTHARARARVTKKEMRNMVIEVDPSTRGKLMTNRIKLGWAICRVDDYIVAKKCYRCSRYNHTFQEC